MNALTVLMQAALSFAILLLLTRMIGKQQVSQLTYYEYINGITFGSIAANMATDDLINMPDHMVGLLAYGALTIGVSYMTLKNRKLRKVINGEPVIVIQNGQILENNLRKMMMNVDELMMVLRTQGVFDHTQLELAIIEPSGAVSLIKKPAYEQPTREDMKLKAKSDGLAIEVIVDGQVIYHNLEQMKLSARWLMAELEKRHVTNFRQVALATVNKQHQLKIDLFDDDLADRIDISDGENIWLTKDNDNAHDPEEPSNNWGKRPDRIL